MKKITDIGDFPQGLSQPALRALATARLTSLKQLTTVTEKEVAGLHGMGPKGANLLKEALAAKGWKFK